MTRSTPPRASAALASVIASAGVLFAQPLQGPPAPQNEPVPTFRASVNAVQVSAIVTDTDGNPVTGLTQADFEVIENGVPRPVTTFVAVDLPVREAGLPPVEPDVVSNDTPPDRVYLIVLDDMSAENALRTRHFLRQFIESTSAPATSRPSSSPPAD